MRRHLLCLLLLAACGGGAGRGGNEGGAEEAPPVPPAAFLRSEFCAAYPCNPDGDYELVDGSWGWSYEFVPVLFSPVVQVATRGDSIVGATLTFHRRTLQASGRHEVQERDREVARAFIRSFTGSDCGVADPLAGPVLMGADAEASGLPAHSCGAWRLHYGDMAAGNVVHLSRAPSP